MCGVAGELLPKAEAFRVSDSLLRFFELGVTCPVAVFKSYEH